MRRRRLFIFKKDRSDDMLINLTPLIDVVFVVLVAFILIAPLLEVEKIDLAAAAGMTAKELSNKSKIAIYVRDDNSIWLNGCPVTDIELTAKLRRLKKENPGFAPQLFHDKKAFFGTYQKVRIAAEKAGFESLDVILKERQD